MQALRLSVMTLALLAPVALSSAAESPGKPAGPTTSPAAGADAEAEYAKTIHDRAGKIVETLDVGDAAKAARVQQTIAGQYRALRDIHAGRDAQLKALKAEAGNGKPEEAKVQAIRAGADQQMKTLHDQYITRLSADLDADQVEKVKDGMTFNVVNVTYKGYLDMLPQLTEPQKTYILQTLKDAREIAMDQGTSNEKHAVFGKYKGRITNYLSKEGYDMKAASKAWMERINAAKVK